MKKSGNRQAERRSLEGGRVQQAVREGSWSGVAEQPPLLDEASTRYPKKRARPKRKEKERCHSNPSGHTHEWMKDTEEVPVYEFNHSPVYFDGFTIRETNPIGYKSRLYKLCVHCGLTLVKSKGSRRWGGKWTEISKARRYYTQYRYKGRKVIH